MDSAFSFVVCSPLVCSFIIPHLSIILAKEKTRHCFVVFFRFCAVFSFSLLMRCCFFSSSLLSLCCCYRVDLLLVSWVCDVLCIVHGTSVAAVLIEWAVWMCNNFVVLMRMLRFEQFLQSNDTAQQQCQFTDDQCLECNQCQESEHQWQKGCSLQFEQQQQWQQQFLCLLTLSTS